MRRPSAFATAGLALAALSLVGFLWVALKAGLSVGNVVRLGESGIMAATIGWAALAAREPVIAGCRSLIGVAVYVATAMLSTKLWAHEAQRYASGFDTYGVGPSRDGQFEGMVAPSWIKIDWISTGEHLANNGGVILLASLAAVVAIRGPRRLRPLLTVLALLPVVYETVTLATDGAEVATVLGVLATAWLAVAIRTAGSAGPRAEPAR